MRILEISANFMFPIWGSTMTKFTRVATIILLVLAVAGLLFVAVAGTEGAQRRGAVGMVLFMYGTAFACLLGLVASFIKDRTLRLSGAFLAAAVCGAYLYYIVPKMSAGVGVMNMFRGGMGTQAFLMFTVPAVLGLVGAALMILADVWTAKSTTTQQDVHQHPTG